MPLGPWKVVRNYEVFCRTVNGLYQRDGKLPQIISFDHDLSVEDSIGFENSPHYVAVEKTGHDCAKWLVDFCIDRDIKLCDFQCHSMNPAGKENILGLLENFKRFQNETPADK